MGEFDVAMLVEQYAGKAASKKLYPAWRGGFYFAVRSKTDSTAPLGLLYVSRWASDEKAEEFAGIYAHALETRYKHLQAEPAQPTAASLDPPAASGQHDAGLRGRHSWTTEEGVVVVEEQGDTVFVSESLDAETTVALEKEVFAK